MYLTLLLIPLGLSGFLAAWIWALADMLRNERDYFWLWFLVLAAPIGIIAYFVNFKILGDDARGLTALRRRRHAEARIEKLRALLQESPIIGHREELARLLFELGRWEECLAELRYLLEFDAENLRAQYEAGMALIALGRDDQARPHLDYVFETQVNFAGWKPALEYAALLERLGDKQGAMSAYKRIRESLAIPEVTYNLARLLIEAGNRNEGITLLESMIHEFEEGPVLHPKRDAPWIEAARKMLGGG